MRPFDLSVQDSALLVIDVQERFVPAIPAVAESEPVGRCLKQLISAARLHAVPTVISEQYPKGLGRTLPALASLLTTPPLEKLEFSAGNNQALARAVLETGRRQVILVGMESHICVFQTARDLVRGGFATFVVEDAVLSRTERNRELGLRLCEKAGATRTGTEAALFDLLGQAGTPEFRALAPLVR